MKRILPLLLVNLLMFGSPLAANPMWITFQDLQAEPSRFEGKRAVVREGMVLSVSSFDSAAPDSLAPTGLLVLRVLPASPLASVARTQDDAVLVLVTQILRVPDKELIGKVVDVEGTVELVTRGGSNPRLYSRLAAVRGYFGESSGGGGLHYLRADQIHPMSRLFYSR